MINKRTIIIGAGIAGLTAALELKKAGEEFLILEAGNEVGGRAKTAKTQSGLEFNEGANWFHSGDDNPLYIHLVKPLNLPESIDPCKTIITYDGIQRHGSELRHSLSANIDTEVAQFPNGDVPLLNLFKSEAIKEYATKLIPLWLGMDVTEQLSARNYWEDISTPGGPIINNRDLLDILADSVGRENIVTNCKVSEINDRGEMGAVITTKDGTEYSSRNIVCTAPLGVLKSGKINFTKGLSPEFQSTLDGMQVAKLTKVIVELDDQFLKSRGIENFHIEVLDKEPNAFCHVGSGGKPIVAVLFGGSSAEQVEKMLADEAKKLAFSKLDVIKEIKGYRDHVVGEPITTKWNTNENTMGSYTNYAKGTSPQGPQKEGNIVFAGDSFGKEFSGCMAGAYISGVEAAKMISTKELATSTAMRENTGQVRS